MTRYCCRGAMVVRRYKSFLATTISIRRCGRYERLSESSSANRLNSNTRKGFTSEELVDIKRQVTADYPSIREDDFEIVVIPR